jgi:hypothetical protein
VRLLLVNILSYALACLTVGVVWGTVAMFWSARTSSLREPHLFMETIFGISGTVVLIAAVPTVVAMGVCKRFGWVSFTGAAIGGFLLGALLFLVMFARWISDGFVSGLFELAALGGGLGVVGGTVFMKVRRAILVRSQPL